jgi:hypothetical protein
MAVESLRAIAWATQVLSGDSAFTAAIPGGVHLGVAPQGTSAPVCVLFVQSAPDYLTFNGNRIWSDGTLMVKVSGPQDSMGTSAAGPLVLAADRADALLTKQTGAAQGGTIVSCVRTSAIPVPEPALVSGVQWMSIVQLFRVLVR